MTTIADRDAYIAAVREPLALGVLDDETPWRYASHGRSVPPVPRGRQRRGYTTNAQARSQHMASGRPGGSSGGGGQPPAVRREQYEPARQAAYAAALEALLAGGVVPVVRLGAVDPTAITGTALAAWRLSWLAALPHPHREGGWHWDQLVARYHREADSLSVAAWARGQLCGLGLAVPTRRRERLRIDYIEGAPVPGHPLRGVVLPIVLEACHQYARALAIPRLELREPLEGALPVYEALGFRLARNPAGAEVYQRLVTP